MSPPPALGKALSALAAGHDLSSDQTEAAVGEILKGEATDVGIAALLAALRMKGETAEELAGAVKAVRSRVVLHGFQTARHGLLDTCGTGGDGARTVNISTAAAVVVAACGVPVVKHGNRAASGNSGSAEVLNALGVEIEPETAVLSRCLEELGITFLYAPKFHAGLKQVAPVRRQLPFRTLFNLIGPLANPAGPEFQLLGVGEPAQASLVAHALRRLGTRRAAVVTGCGGLDEVSLSGPTRALLVERDEVIEKLWVPEDFGLGRSAVEDLRVTGPAESAARITRLLAGEPGPVRDSVVANAAAALWIAGEGSLLSASSRAQEAIDSGRAAALLEGWRRLNGAPRPVDPHPASR